MKKTKQILSVFLSFCMIISCMVGMSVTASAELQCPNGHTGLYNGGNGNYYCSTCSSFYLISELHDPDEAATTTGGFVKVTEASQITEDNIGEATAAEAKEWIKANLTTLQSEQGGVYDFFWKENGTLKLICLDYDELDEDNVNYADVLNPSIGHASQFFSSNEKVYFWSGSSTPAQQWTNGNVTATLDGTKLTVAKTDSAENGNMGTGWTKVGSASAWRDIRGNITEIEIQDGVTSIGADAFYRCTSLTSITIPSGVTSIGNAAFSSCSKLTSVTIPGSVTSIGGSAFGSCTALTSISLPSGVTSIGANAFNGCSNLTSVTFPSGLTIIEDTVFANCSALTSVTFPSSLNSIGQRAFHKCTVLASVTFTPGQEGGGLTIGDSAFDEIPSTTKVTYGTGNTRLYNGETEITTTTALTAIQSKTLTWKASSATVAVTSVTLNKTTTTLTVDGTETLTVTVEPNNATDKTVTWTSSDTSVATVANGVVTAVKAGTATITATAGDKTATCTVTVKSAVVPVTEIKLNYTTYSTEVGDTNALSVGFTPADATDLTLTFASSDTNVVKISDKGFFEAVGAGTATLTVTATNGTADTSDDVTATCVVTVTAVSGGGNTTPIYVPTNIVTPTPATPTETETVTPAAGTFEDITDEEDNAGEAQISTPKSELADAILTDSDRTAMAKGEDVKVYLEVGEVKPTAEEAALVEEAAAAEDEELVIAAYFDIDLFKQVGENSAVQVHETNGQIEVSIDLPEELINTDPDIERSYYIARIHDGEVEILDADFDPETGLITFRTDKFSLYAILFVDEAVAETVAEPEPTEDISIDEEPTDKPAAAVDAAAAEEETNPHTGAPLAGLSVLAMSASAAAAAFTAKKRKNK